VTKTATKYVYVCGGLHQRAWSVSFSNLPIREAIPGVRRDLEGLMGRSLYRAILRPGNLDHLTSAARLDEDTLFLSFQKIISLVPKYHLYNLFHNNLTSLTKRIWIFCLKYVIFLFICFLIFPFPSN
jgi:hypothetical protein